MEGTLVYGSVLLVLGFALLWVTALFTRTTKRSSRSYAFESAKTGFFHSQVILCIVYISFSFLLISPDCFHSDIIESSSSSNLVTRFLVRDTKAIVNVVHALVFFGLTVHLFLHPQLFLTEVSYTVIFYLTITSLVFVIIQVVQVYLFGIGLPFIISIILTLAFSFAQLKTLKFKRELELVQSSSTPPTHEKKTDENDIKGGFYDKPPDNASTVESFLFTSFLAATEIGQDVKDSKLTTLRGRTMFWALCELQLFVVYNLVVLGLRLSTTVPIEVPFSTFIEGFSQACTTSIYKAAVVAFGYYGAKHLLVKPLSYYALGTIVSAVMSVVGLFPIVHSSYSLSFISICMLGGFIYAFQLRKALQEKGIVEPKGNVRNSDLGYARKSGNHNIQDQLRRLGIAVVGNVVLWQWEAITIACLPLLEASVGNSVNLSAVALNFSVHGTYIFVLQFFKCVDGRSISTRRMWHIILASAIALISVGELCSVHFYNASSFFSLASFIFLTRTCLCLFLVYSLLKLKQGPDLYLAESPKPAGVMHHVLPAEVDRLHFSANAFLKLFFAVFFIFSSILLVHSRDYSGLIGNFTRSGILIFSFLLFILTHYDVGWQSPGYVTAFHFCYIFVGMGYQGINNLNAKKLGYVTYCGAGVGIVTGVHTTLLIS